MFKEGKEIYHHLRTNILIQFSFGFNSPKLIAYGLQFCVKGLAFEGLIKIRLNRLNGTYIIFMFNKQGQQVRKMWDIELGNLIPTLQQIIDGADGDFWQNFKKRYVTERKA